MPNSPKPPSGQPPALLRDANFCWLTGGSALSMLGDQFTLIALPWLVLQLTGDTRVLGTVLALISVPRAAFILFGGAVVDRYSPHRVLMLTRILNTLLLGVLAALVLSGHTALQGLYPLALSIGISTAFSIPAATSITPHVVPRAHLQAANGIGMGLRQMSLFLGPVLAGLLIAGFGDDSGERANTTGIGLAFAFDALTYAIAAWTLSRVQMRPTATAAAPVAGGPAQHAHQGVVRAVWQGLTHFWADAELRAFFLYFAAVAVLIMGPVHIALPVLANTRPELGAAALGTMLGAHGLGTLLGMVASGMLPRLRLRTLGTTVLTIDLLIGLMFMPIGTIHAAWQGAALMLVMGLLGGFMQVSVFTWIQQRVPPALLGRAMSLFMFIFLGLAPTSAAVTGWVMSAIPLQQLFLGCGTVLMLLAALALLLSPMRRIADVAAAPR